MAAKNREKDQAMAARLKIEGDKREYFRCPVCNQIVSMRVVYNHIAFHPV